MYCNQCEQTLKGLACTAQGVCGKKEESAHAQDSIVFALRGLALAALQAREKNIIDVEVDRLCVKALFSTLTNVQFDTPVLEKTLSTIQNATNTLAQKAAYTVPAQFSNFTDEDVSVQYFDTNPDILSLKQLLLYGLKGVAAYADHAGILHSESSEFYTLFYKLLAAGYDGVSRSLDDWLALVLTCGELNLQAMQLLDTAHTSTFGHPVPTEVSLAPVVGKAILVSGHDLLDLKNLLEQTKDTGISIYTHGEMLPAHGYPELKKYTHLAGHFGTAWQNQQKEFPLFPGAILFTTNCIQRPAKDYEQRVFTTGLVGWPNIAHVPNSDFSAVIACAQEEAGFTETDVAHATKKSVVTGFAHNAVLGVADTIIDAVKSGAIRHFFLVGGCDGAKPGRNYYTDFVEQAPQDTVVLTLACGKFRFFDKDLGTINGIPRLLDIGQCNDAFSAIQIALALANAFDCSVNELPLSLILSWYEQKAVAILLSLLALGIKNIHLGPSLPAFVSPAILDVLVKNYNIKPITTAEEDLKAILGK